MTKVLCPVCDGAARGETPEAHAALCNAICDRCRGTDRAHWFTRGPDDACFKCGLAMPNPFSDLAPADRGPIYCAACVRLQLNPDALKLGEKLTYTPGVRPEGEKFRPFVLRSDDPNHIMIYDMLLDTSDDAMAVAREECWGMAEADAKELGIDFAQASIAAKDAPESVVLGGDDAGICDHGNRENEECAACDHDRLSDGETDGARL